jgi:ATP-binding cassette subfamily B protein
VVESGTHAALLAQKGLYAKLHTLNYASFDDLPDDMAALNART